MKPVLALLMIVNLLACPMRCLSCDANVADAGARPVETTSCCADCCCESKLPVSDLPSPCQGDDCDCQDCICKGAVLKAEVKLPQTLVVWCSWFESNSRVSRCADALPSVRVEHSRKFCSTFYTGRAARIGLQSLLI